MTAAAWTAFASVLERAPFGTLVIDPGLCIVAANACARRTFGEPGAPVSPPVVPVLRRLFTASCVGTMIERVGEALQHVAPGTFSNARSDDWTATADRLFEWHIQPVELPDGRRGAACYFRDVSADHRDRRILARAQVLASGQSRALELALAGGSIHAVMHVLAETCRALPPYYAPTAIFTADAATARLRLVAADGVDAAYVQALDGSHLSAPMPCNTAARTGVDVIISDVHQAPEWCDYRSLADAHGIRATWAFPIRSADGRILGAFTQYHRLPRTTDDSEVESLQLLSRTAGVLLERQQGLEERRAAEDALRQSERRFRIMADAMPQLVWTSTDTGVVTYYNARASNYDGVAAHPGGGFEWQGLLHPDDVQTTVAAWKEASVRRRPFAVEHRLRMASGAYRWHLSRAEPGLVEDGEDTGLRWFGTATDVHDLRIAQDALRANDERLREADRRKNEFLAILAHELRNPLAPIRSGLHVMRLASEGSETTSRVRVMMERQVAHMVRLIDDLLDVSRITSGKIRLKRQPSPLHDLVQNAVDANRAAVADGGLTLDVSLPDTGICLDVDPTRFVQILSNLLHNAVKFTPAGGRIAITGRLEPADPAEPDALVLSVTDTGVGIAPEMRPRVFELFSQVETGTERTHGGLGIGLGLARQLTEMHGGRITVESGGIGQGSTFVLRMPVLPLAPPEDPMPSPEPARAALHRRVLIVDDNADAAETLALLVRQLGGETRTAHDGATAIADAGTFAPHVVLLDIGMPGIDGYETCRRIRATTSGLLIVALTGWGQEQDKSRVLEAGFDAHLTKPADPATLLALIASAREAPRA